MYLAVVWSVSQMSMLTLLHVVTCTSDKTFVEILSIIYWVAAIDFLFPIYLQHHLFLLKPHNHLFGIRILIKHFLHGNFMKSELIIFCIKLFIFLKSETHFKSYTLFYTYFNIVFELTSAIVEDVLFTMASSILPNCCCTYLHLLFWHLWYVPYDLQLIIIMLNISTYNMYVTLIFIIFRKYIMFNFLWNVLTMHYHCTYTLHPGNWFYLHKFTHTLSWLVIPILWNLFLVWMLLTLSLKSIW